jgi:hypothetical protein
MRTIVIMTAFLGALAGIASATTAATKKMPNATPITKVTNCQTTCYNAGAQRICNTHCY